MSTYTSRLHLPAMGAANSVGYGWAQLRSSSPQTGHSGLHEMKMNGNVMQMREMEEGLEIRPGQKTELKPAANHVMFTELREPLKESDTLKGQLRFEEAGLVDIECHVDNVGALAPDQHTGQTPHQHSH